ncbi:Phosphoinositide phospholipase C [Fusarium keratoplasticum]|uniref:Phosphoinositide phospholipase C n=1 Tax=Fusarium keratoplasticum TaxID=1328300 RepID=A0ACC0QM32_9HYPO|nr:Phosphoinositide phospholipase C [Fusarium keratoplasticum]KAI8657878.1 Phosphoinositide phospholipase C [Fusarium keratoplasticum]
MSLSSDFDSKNTLTTTSLHKLSDMSSLTRSHLTQVQTTFPSHTQPVPIPMSAISASSVASNSQQGSPIMSPDTAVLTTNSSAQPSPEPMRGREEEVFPSSFQLPESVLFRKMSENSSGQSLTSNPSAMSEVVGGNRSIMRRLSNRAHRFATSRRRQSSAAPASRDGSVGPSILRRRSDSNATAPPESSVLTDTDEEVEFVPDDSISFVGLDGAVYTSSANSTHGSISGSAGAMAGPVLPAELRNGSSVLKVSRKARPRKINLIYETETNKLSWDPARPHKSLHVDEIREIRTDSDIQQYILDFGMAQITEADKNLSDNWFTIIYTVPESSKTKFLHIVTDNIASRILWTEFLDAMLRYRQELMTSLMAFNDRAIAQYWQSEMTREFGDSPRGTDQEELDIAGVKRVCQSLHICSSQSTLEVNFHLADSRRRQKLNFTEFKDFVRRMKQRTDVQRLIRSIAANPELGLTLAEFLDFLRDEQGEDVDSNRASWEKLFSRYSRRYRTDEVDTAENAQTMSEAAFVGFLTSEDNGPIAPEPQEYTLDRPMNEYFISSSHNTYLLGRQVAGQSSVEGYISALVRGCRCVEVDCWDGYNGQPEVNHGRTMTTSISFKEVMTTINKYAFIKSKFPLWISLEVHCSPSQQATMVEIIKDCFGSRLVTETLDAFPDKLPSPSELMERVLIKVKKPQIKEEVVSAGNDFRGRRRGNSLNSPMIRPTVPDSAAIMPSQSLPQSPMLTPSHSTRRLVSKTRVNTITEGQVQDMMSSSTSDNESGAEQAAKKAPNKTVKVLGDLGVYCAGVKFSGFDTADAKQYNHIFSFMEASFAKHSRTKEQKMALDIHNMRYMMRVYPDRTRITSNNFDPLIYWRRGVQMAALNWQTFDLGMQLNRAMFDGGKDYSGYVLKPAELRDIQVLPYNSDIAEGKKERSVVTFSIDVISAQQLMRPANLPANKSINPYVEVEVFHANDKRDKKESECILSLEPDSPPKVQTDIKPENGFNPMFDKHFKFRVTTKHPDLVFVRWSVKLSTDGESYNERPAVATYTAKLTNLKQGYRTLPLLNHAGDQYLFSKLFCKIKVDPVEKKLIDAPRRAQDGGNKLNRLGGKVFSRINTSPKSTIEKSSSEKTSFDSY